MTQINFNFRRPTRQCVIIEKSNAYLQNRPKYVSYSFISIQSNISLTNEGGIRIASIRGATAFDIDFKQTSAVSSNSDFNPTNLAKRDDFSLKRQDSDHIFLKRSLIGPQEIKLEFVYTTKQNEKKIIMNRLLLTIYVSKFSF